MTIIVCLDDCGGMTFAGRRQSRDSKVLEDIKNNYEPIYINSFSEKLIAPSGIKYTLTDNIDALGEGDTVFIENLDVSKYAHRVSRVIIYKWNRKYLSELKFTLDMSGYTKKSVSEFAGSSHDKITREVYEK